MRARKGKERKAHLVVLRVSHVRCSIHKNGRSDWQICQDCVDRIQAAAKELYKLPVAELKKTKVIVP